jgi:hypothetical protein
VASTTAASKPTTRLVMNRSSRTGSCASNRCESFACQSQAHHEITQGKDPREQDEGHLKSRARGSQLSGSYPMGVYATTS